MCSSDLREPLEVAQEHADQELRQGNVCLSQAGRDLRLAKKEHKIQELCEQIFREELRESLVRAEKEKLHPDFFQCVANAVAQDEKGGLRILLSFRGTLFLKEKVPAKFRRAGFPVEAMSWALPPYEQSSALHVDWKEALRGGSCSFHSKVLDRFLDRYLAEKKNARELALCSKKRAQDLEKIVKLQSQLENYVPGDWVDEASRGKGKSLFEPPIPVDPAVTLQDCMKAREVNRDQLRKLKKASERIADRYGIPALDSSRQEGKAPAIGSEED